MGRQEQVAAVLRRLGAGLDREIAHATLNGFGESPHRGGLAGRGQGEIARIVRVSRLVRNILVRRHLDLAGQCANRPARCHVMVVQVFTPGQRATKGRIAVRRFGRDGLDRIAKAAGRRRHGK